MSKYNSTDNKWSIINIMLMTGCKNSIVNNPPTASVATSNINQPTVIKKEKRLARDH